MALLKTAPGVSRVHASRRVFEALQQAGADIPVRPAGRAGSAGPLQQGVRYWAAAAGRALLAGKRPLSLL